jgi:hypothetical protein
MIKIEEKLFTRLERNPITGQLEFATYFRVVYI